MRISVAEIRDRAKWLRSAVERREYENRSGAGELSPLAEIYEEHRLLMAPEVVPSLQRALAGASGEERQRLKALLRCVAGQQIKAAVARFEDELRSWEAGTTVSLAGEEVPMKRMSERLMRTANRRERLEWAAARHVGIEEADALRLDVLHREREAVGKLGLGRYVEAREQLSGLDLQRMRQLAGEILERTDSTYRKAFRKEAGSRIDAGDGPPPGRYDALWLMGMHWLDRPFEIQRFFARLRQDVESMKLPLGRGAGVRADFERRPRKDAESFCAAIRVPGDIVLCICPTGGWADARAALRETGHALHYACASPSQAWEERVLGDPSIGESFALLFEGLALDVSWVRSVLGLDGERLEEYVSLAGFLQLYRLRRLAVHVLWELEVAGTERPAERAGHYAEAMSEATGFAHDPSMYLWDYRHGFWAAWELRGWVLSAIVLDRLRRRFGNQWYRDSAAGNFLREVLSAGQRESAVELATQLGADGLSPETLVSWIKRWR